MDVKNLIAEQKFLNYFLSTITHTSDIPSTIMLIIPQFIVAEAFKPNYIGTYYIFFLTPEFQMIGSDQLKYRLISAWIG